MVWMELAEQYGPIIGLKLGNYINIFITLYAHISIRDHKFVNYIFVPSGAHYIVTVAGSEAVKEVLSREEFDGRPDGFFFRLRTFGKRLGKKNIFEKYLTFLKGAECSNED